MNRFSFLSTPAVKRGLLAVAFVAGTSLSSYAVNVDSSSHYVALGKQEQEAKRYLAAWKHFEAAAKHNPANADAQLGIAAACRKMNRNANAIKALEEAVKLRPNDNATLRQLIEMQFDYGQWATTIALGKKLFQRNPEEKGLAYMMGKSYYHQQDYANALPALKEAVKEDGKNAETQYLLGRIYVMMSNYKPAVPHYEKSLQLDSTTQPTRYYEYAQVLAMADKFDESIKWFEMALSKGFKARDDFYMNYAYTLADGKKTEQALEVFRKMLVRRPQDIALLQAMADVCYHSGRYMDAVKHWDNVLAIKKEDPRTLYHIGLAYIKMGKDVDGKKLCDQAIALEPALGVLRHEKSMSF